MDKLVLTAPNFSEGKDLKKINKLFDCFRSRQELRVIRWQNDPDHNRCSCQVIGAPDQLAQALVDAVELAVELIDMTKHKGQHPRMGCVDVIPLTPLRNCTMEECTALAHQIAKTASERCGQPFFLYEASALAPYKKNLSNIRKGEFEGMAEKMKDPMWQPDYGPATIHPTGGVTAIGARDFMVALNVNLNSTDLSIAKSIAKRVRHSSGGLCYVKAIGVERTQPRQVQVSMDLTNYRKTSIYTAVELVRAEAAKYGVSIASCQVGMLSMDMLIQIARDYLNLESLFPGPFSEQQIFETYLL